MVINNVGNLNDRPLKIVQVLPNYRTIPADDYGGIERVVYDLTEELVKVGHDIYIFARHGSITSAKLIEYPFDHPHIVQFVFNNIPQDVDIIHDHTPDSLIGMLRPRTTTICTVHNCGSYNKAQNSVFISSRSRQVLANGEGEFVYNGVNIEEYQFSDNKEDYLLYIGAWSPHKGVALAIEVAEKTGQVLKLAGPILDWNYFEKELKWRIDGNWNIYPLGVVGGEYRQQLYKHAKCVLFPSVCEEAFGLVMIESMACGTPVLGLNNGAIPEVLQGFPELICKSVDEMVEKVIDNKFPEPSELRQYVMDNFTVGVMTRKYVDLYYKILDATLD